MCERLRPHVKYRFTRYIIANKQLEYYASHVKP